MLTCSPRFVDTEKWRAEFGGGVDALVPEFKYTEKEKIFEYYPQYYHKTDKVLFSRQTGYDTR